MILDLGGIPAPPEKPILTFYLDYIFLKQSKIDLEISFLFFLRFLVRTVVPPSSFLLFLVVGPDSLKVR